MVGVTEAGSDVALYCIDKYEAFVTGELGDSDQYAADSIPTTAVAESRAGVIPSRRISFGQALAICRNTPVIGPDAERRGFKRLATVAEWQDAADGVVGPGGTRYPYGDTFDPEACATASEQGKLVHGDLKPTGSFPRCRSAFGTYDQTGGLYEWADPGAKVDADAWFEIAAKAGIDLKADEQGMLWSGSSEVLSQVDFHNSLQMELELDGSGRLQFLCDPEKLDDLPDCSESSYLMIDAERFTEIGVSWAGLLIQLPPEERENLPAYLPLLLDREHDGAPIAAKLGGAFYSGGMQELDEVCYDHPHDFDGDIGFRCACDPL